MRSWGSLMVVVDSSRNHYSVSSRIHLPSIDIGAPTPEALPEPRCRHPPEWPGSSLLIEMVTSRGNPKQGQANVGDSDSTMRWCVAIQVCVEHYRTDLAERL